VLSLPDLLAAIVRGERPPAGALARFDADTLRETASHHGLLPLLAERLDRTADVRADIRAMLSLASLEAVAADLMCERELRRCLAALERAGVRPLVVKGGQLSYTHYPRPDLRPRVDTDILIPIDMRATVDHVLTAEGYELSGHASGDLMISQAPYAKRAHGLLHAMDVHWRIANPQVFSGVLSYEELAAPAVPIPALGAGARGLSDVHALLLACVHRVAHHYDSDCLIWLYDIHLIAPGLDRAAWNAFADLAVARGVATVCRVSLDRAADRFGTAVPAGVLTRLGPSQTDEASVAYLDPDRRHVHLIVTDLRALPSWHKRWHLLREHLFPPAEYMRDVYAPASRAPLALLYARRALRGARKWLIRAS
jgi:hypothetical protein